MNITIYRESILLKGVLIPRLDNKPDPSFLLINLDFLLLQTEQIDFNISLLFFVLKNFWNFIFCVFFTYNTISFQCL